MYMGLTPESRGRGWGLAVTRHAQWLAGQSGRERMVLAADAANAAGDTVWVIDGDSHLVAVHGPAGDLRGSWLAEGLSDPQGIATDGEDVWIVDSGSQQVIRFDATAPALSGNVTPGAVFDLSGGRATY